MHEGNGERHKRKKKAVCYTRLETGEQNVNLYSVPFVKSVVNNKENDKTREARVTELFIAKPLRLRTHYQTRITKCASATSIIGSHKILIIIT